MLKSEEIKPLLKKDKVNKPNNFLLVAIIAIILIVSIYLIVPSKLIANENNVLVNDAVIPEATSTTLRVAYIEHVTTYANNVTNRTYARTIMTTNLNKLETQVANASKNSVKLILFPEFALTGLVNFLAASMTPRVAMAYYLEQIPSVGIIACNNSAYSDRPILQRLSCMAKTYSIYMSVNWGDYVTCTKTSDSNCPSNNQYQYNTQIVFNKNGSIVAKYYKIHGFNEDEYDFPSINYTSGTYFTMYYGTNDAQSMKIGLATCFDSMYAVPIWYLMKSENINFFLLSHWWVNGGISSTATQWFEALSRQYNINLVVAASTWYWTSSSIYPYSSSGSGIYSQGKVLSEYFNWASTSTSDTLGYADVPVSLSTSTSSPNFTVTTIPTYLNSSSHPSTFQYCSYNLGYAVAGQTLSGRLSCPSFNCSASLKVSSLAKPYYNYWTMYGIQNYYNTSDGNHVYYYEEICAIYCSTCTTYVGSTQFDTINVTGNFNSNGVPFVLMMQNYGSSYVNAVNKTSYTMNKGAFSLRGSGIYPDYLNDITIQTRVFSLDTYYSG